MTTRFSLGELADMLHVRVDVVRQAVEALESELTGESFVYNERTWRIAPSDVKRVQMWIEEHRDSLQGASQKRDRRVRMKRIEEGSDTESDGAGDS